MPPDNTIDDLKAELGIIRQSLADLKLQPGPPGKDGTNGINGKDGRDGVDGRGIETITLEGTTIVVVLTDGTTQRIDIPIPDGGIKYFDIVPRRN